MLSVWGAGSPPAVQSRYPAEALTVLAALAAAGAESITSAPSRPISKQLAGRGRDTKAHPRLLQPACQYRLTADLAVPGYAAAPDEPRVLHQEERRDHLRSRAGRDGGDRRRRRRRRPPQRALG